MFLLRFFYCIVFFFFWQKSHDKKKKKSLNTMGRSFEKRIQIHHAMPNISQFCKTVTSVHTFYTLLLERFMPGKHFSLANDLEYWIISISTLNSLQNFTNSV